MFHVSDADDETIDNDKDDEDINPSWKLCDAELFLSDDMEIETAGDEFEMSPRHKEKTFWFLVLVLMNFWGC